MKKRTQHNSPRQGRKKNTPSITHPSKKKTIFQPRELGKVSSRSSDDSGCCCFQFMGSKRKHFHFGSGFSLGKAHAPTTKSIYQRCERRESDRMRENCSSLGEMFFQLHSVQRKRWNGEQSITFSCWDESLEQQHCLTAKNVNSPPSKFHSRKILLMYGA